jgi:hypothetical protein
MTTVTSAEQTPPLAVTTAAPMALAAFLFARRDVTA